MAGEGDLLGMIEMVAREKGLDRQVLVDTIEAAILKAAQAAFGPTREMEARLKEDFRKQLVALNRQQTVTPSHDNTKLEELTATIQTLMKQMAERDRQTVQVVTVNQESKPDEACPDSTGDGISDDISTRLHAKTMQRLEKKVTGASNVDHESKKTRNDISTNIDELENML